MKIHKGDLLMTKQGMAIRVRSVAAGRFEIDVPSGKGWRKFPAKVTKRVIAYKIA